MRYFVTGASGFVGSAVLRELRGAGHEVLALARSDASAQALEEAGAQVHRGSLDDPQSLVAGATACDGVAHLAFNHDFSKFQENIEADRRVVEAMATALEGSHKPLVVTFGVALISPGRTATEDMAAGATSHPRSATEAVVQAAAARGVRASVLRLPPSTHGAGDHGFVPMLIALAREKGIAAYVGDGANRWPAVHRVDAARLYRHALEDAAPGTRLHAIAEEGIPMRAIAETIGRGLGVPVASLTPDEAGAHFGWMARFVAMDAPSSSAATRETFGWLPKEVDLLTDMRENHYFA